MAFASDKADDLRKKGYSGKHNRVQVVLALMQTYDGLPVGYELFQGNTADVKTLEPAIASLKKRFELGRVVFVADSGMLSADNVALLRSLDHDYVVAARLRSMKAADFAKVTASHTWHKTADGRKVTEVGGWSCVTVRSVQPKRRRNGRKRSRKPNNA